VAAVAAVVPLQRRVEVVAAEDVAAIHVPQDRRALTAAMHGTVTRRTRLLTAIIISMMARVHTIP